MKQIEVDTLVIGAGLLGSSVAMHLAKLGVKDVRVVDLDLDGSQSSSELNAGGVRATWVQPINIQMSKLSIEFFSTVAMDVGYRPCGYLWLHTEKTYASGLKARERQIEFGWPVENWTPAQLRDKVPFIDKTEDLAGALFAPRDGLLNPNLLKSYYRGQAKKNGAIFDDRIWVSKAKNSQGSWWIDCQEFPPMLSSEERSRLFSNTSGGSVPSSAVQYKAKNVVNCAGPWASQIARVLGYECPSQPVRRQVCIFDCRGVDLTPYGMIVDTSGVYFHPEATNGLAGFANPDEPPGFNFHYDGEEFFMEQVWSKLYERSTYFERLRHITGWAGLYEVSPDETGIVGEVTLGEVGRAGGVFEAHSFSGHGVMHSYSAGLVLAEKIKTGKYQTLDVSILNGNRFAKGALIHETQII
jgi:sarcosine oxidase subunit beta